MESIRFPAPRSIYPILDEALDENLAADLAEAICMSIYMGGWRLALFRPVPNPTSWDVPTRIWVFEHLVHEHPDEAFAPFAPDVSRFVPLVLDRHFDGDCVDLVRRVYASGEGRRTGIMTASCGRPDRR